MNKKLYTIVKNTKVYDFYKFDSNSLIFSTINDFPFMTYPNNQPIFELNSYLLTLFFNGKSSFDGGTLKTYAKQISHLIRFCYKKNINKISDLNDDSFCLFIYELKNEKFNEHSKRSNSHVISIGKQCINFLFYVAKLYSLDNFIGEEDFNAIRVIKAYQSHNKSKTKTVFYSHRSFPKPSAAKKRLPIGESTIAKLKDHVINKTSDKDIGFRNLCYLEALEQTGARRSEILLLKTSHIQNALKNNWGNDSLPQLEVPTLKRGNRIDSRSIPVSKNFLQNLSFYIRKIRKKYIKNLDHDYIFISHRTGKVIQPDTITKIIYNICQEAAITEEAFAHLFRHYYITEKLKFLIQQYKLNNPDEFRLALLNIESLKFKLQQWTGHLNVNSLEHYLNLVFADISNFNDVHKLMIQNDSITSVSDQIALLISKLENPHKGITKNELIQLKESLKTLQDSLKSSKKHNSK